MAAKGTYRLFVTDTQAGEVTFLGTIREEGRKAGEQVPGVIALRLKVVNRQIPEVETLVVRNERFAQNFEKIGTPNHLFQEAVPLAERMSREDLVKTANMYFTGMQQNDGKGVYPFADDCNRIENGSQSTNVPPADGKPAPDPKTATNYSSAWSCKAAVRIRLAAFRDAHSRPALCGRGSGTRHGLQLYLLRSFGGQYAHIPDPGWAHGNGRPEPAVDLGAGRAVQGRKGQDAGRSRP